MSCLDYFINVDETTYIQLVIITEIALYDLEQYVKSLKQQNMKEEEIRNILA